MKVSSLGQFTKYSINTIANQFIILVISFLISIITARVLGPEGKGQLTLILLIPMLSITFGRMGIGHAVNYYASRTSSTKLIVNSFVLSILLSILLVALTLPVAYALKDVFFKTINEKLIVLISFFIPFYIFNNHFISLLQGLYKINIRNLLLVSQPMLNLLLLIILITILKLGLNGAVIASIIALLFAVFLSGIFLLKEIKVKEISLDFSLMRQLLTFGFKSHIGNILKDLSYRSDILIISYFLPAAFVGYYVIAVTIAEIIWKIPDAVGSVLLPHVAQMDNNSAKTFTPVVSRVVLVPVTIACLMIFLFGKNIITLAFGQEFLPSSSVLVILLPGILSFALWKILANDLIAQGYPVRYSLTSGIALVTMIVLDLLLIPKFGINGAAVASTVSYIAAAASIIFIYTRITGNSFKDLLIPVRSDFSFYKNYLRK